MRQTMARFALILSAIMSIACGSPEKNFSKLAEEFVYTTLAFSPASATSAGLHQYQGRNLDEQLDDLSPAAVDHHRAWYERFRQRLQSEVKLDALPAESRADYRIVADQTELALLDLQEIQSHLHN